MRSSNVTSALGNEGFFWLQRHRRIWDLGTPLSSIKENRFFSWKPELTSPLSFKFQSFAYKKFVCKNKIKDLSPVLHLTKFYLSNTHFQLQISLLFRVQVSDNNEERECDLDAMHNSHSDPIGSKRFTRTQRSRKMVQRPPTQKTKGHKATFLLSRHHHWTGSNRVSSVRVKHQLDHHHPIWSNLHVRQPTNHRARCTVHEDW